MTAEREAIIRVKAEGHAQAAQAEQQVADAQQHVADAAKAQAEALEATAAKADQAAESTEKLADAEDRAGKAADSLTGLLDKIHPGLGEVARTGEKLINVVDDLATGKLKLSDIVDGLTNKVKQYAGVFKLLGTGGPAVASVLVLIGVFKQLVDETERALQKIKEVQEARSTAAESRESKRQRLEDTLASQGNLTEENVNRATSIQQQLERRGFGAVSVDAAAALAPSDVTNFDNMRAIAAGIERGEIDPKAGNLQGQLDAIGQDPAKLQALVQHVQTRDSQRSRLTGQANQAAQSTTDEFGVVEATLGPSVVDENERFSRREIVGQLTGKVGQDLEDHLDMMALVNADRNQSGWEIVKRALTRSQIQNQLEVNRQSSPEYEEAGQTLDRLNQAATRNSSSPPAGVNIQITYQETHHGQKNFGPRKQRYSPGYDRDHDRSG